MALGAKLHLARGAFPNIGLPCWCYILPIFGTAKEIFDQMPLDGWIGILPFMGMVREDNSEHIRPDSMRF